MSGSKTVNGFYLLALVLVGFYVWTLVTQWNSCVDAGGHYVRTLFWFECLK